MPKATSSADRAQRLIALLGQLRLDKRLRISDLAAELGTTEAELTDDLVTLSMCGVAPYGPDTLVPLIIEDGFVEVWGEMPAVRGPVRLSGAEARALVAALQTGGFGASNPLVVKLLEAAASTSFDSDEIASTLQATASGHEADTFEILSRASAEHEIVKIEYARAGATGAASREVEPVALILERGAWYLTGWCRTSDDWRTFRIDRIHRVETIGRRFDPRTDAPPLPTSFLAAALPFARLRFLSGEAYSERDWPGSVVAERTADGALTVEVPYSGTAWIARMVTAHLGRVVAISPAEVVSEVARTASAELARLDA